MLAYSTNLGPAMFSMRFCIVLLGAIIATMSASRDSMADEQLTFVVPHGEKKSSLQDILISQKKTANPFDINAIGISIFTGEFSEEEIDQLKENGYVAVPPLEVALFDTANCRNPSPIKPFSFRIVPAGVCRVVGTTPLTIGANTPKVWIVDSGVDAPLVSAGFLTVELQVDCVTSNTCTDVTAAPCAPNQPNTCDNLGHGTMIAGLIGGQSVGTGSNIRGITGVSPGVKLKIVKVFDEQSDADVWGAPLRGLGYVADHAQVGDIVNISWGVDWLSGGKKDGFSEELARIDQLLHAMADRQVRIVIAGGNLPPGERGWHWVQTFAPANSGSYLSTVVDPASPLPLRFPGAIYSVSASNSVNGAGTTWTDTLWKRSVFGASIAEPGVRMLSLWMSDDDGEPKVNVCSGTSFAAPVLAGLLVRGATPSQPPAPTDSPMTGKDAVGFNATGDSVNMNNKPRRPTCN
jgi:hypothetical protein